MSIVKGKNVHTYVYAHNLHIPYQLPTYVRIIKVHVCHDGRPSYVCCSCGATYA